MADKRTRRAAQWVPPLAAFVFILGCASDVPSQQAAAYSTATGFLTLCDDADFDHALSHFAKPLKASTSTDTWIKQMTAHRGAYGIPVLRALVSRDTQNLPGRANDPTKINFLFRTSFLGTTPGDEYVSVEKMAGHWQVYDYKFRPSGKPPSEKPNPNIEKALEEKTYEEQRPSQYQNPGHY
ncbi:MAG: DUF4019 domain-containing protein [Verrucomicrobia bacterium]|nr:DUF4019 domain-containing protein [Verrucomicrobiota bacterium]